MVCASPFSNNGVEGWHNRLSNLIDRRAHPDLGELVEILGREELGVRVKISQHQAGQVKVKDRKTVEKEMLLSEALEKLEVQNVGDYLEKVIEIMYR